jgi:UPF0042 nucleotide-binding protein
MKLKIISGRSGSGKSTALHVLEDMGYYCIDNLPAGLLPHLTEQISPRQNTDDPIQNIAVSIDARNTYTDFTEFPALLSRLESSGEVHCEVIYLDARSPTLIKRFSETRRKHPLSDKNTGLKEAIAMEKKRLSPIALRADLTIDTSTMTLHELRDLIKKRVGNAAVEGIALLFQSFGFKHGIPVDADFVFDVRCLPNPYWKPNLRSQTGLDKDVIDFLLEHNEVTAMFADIQAFLEKWLPSFQQNNRSYMTVAIGCTGGQHRSVYLCELLKDQFEKTLDNVQVRHRELA